MTKKYNKSKNCCIFLYCNGYLLIKGYIMKTEMIDDPFIGDDGKYHYLYKIINNVNNNYYYGVHSCNSLEKDSYSGSGKTLKKAIKKYGSDNFTKLIIKFFKTEDEKYKSEKEIITEKELNNKNCYNISSGGLGGRNGMVVVFDENGEKIVVTKKYVIKNGLVSVNSGHGNPSYNKKKNIETKIKISNAIKEYYKTHKHKKHSNDEKRNQSEKLKGRFCLEQNNIRKFVSIYEVNELIKKGWKLKPGHKYYINNGENSILVNRFEHKTLYRNWVKGKLKKVYKKTKKETYKDIAKRTGFCAETVSKYIKQYGYIDKDLVEKVKQENIKYTGKKYLYNDEYLTLMQFSKKYNIDYNTLKSRIKLGWTINEIIENGNIKNRRRKSKLYEYEGNLYSIPELSRKFKISETMLRQRIENGMSISDSVLIKNKKDNCKKFLYKGKEYTVSEISKIFGIKLSTVKQRIKNGWEIVDVIEKKIRKS